MPYTHKAGYSATEDTIYSAGSFRCWDVSFFARNSFADIELTAFIYAIEPQTRFVSFPVGSGNACGFTPDAHTRRRIKKKKKENNTKTEEEKKIRLKGNS